MKEKRGNGSTGKKKKTPHTQNHQKHQSPATSSAVTVQSYPLFWITVADLWVWKFGQESRENMLSHDILDTPRL